MAVMTHAAAERGVVEERDSVAGDVLGQGPDGEDVLGAEDPLVLAEIDRQPVEGRHRGCP